MTDTSGVATTTRKQSVRDSERRCIALLVRHHIEARFDGLPPTFMQPMFGRPTYYTLKSKERCPFCGAYTTVNRNGLLRKHACLGGGVMVRDEKQAKEKQKQAKEQKASEIDAVVGLCMLTS